MAESYKKAVRYTAHCEVDYSRLYERLKRIVMEEVNGLGIGGAVNPEALVSMTETRNMLIRHAYWTQRRRGVKAEALYWELGSQYHLACNTVKYIVNNGPVVTAG